MADTSTTTNATRYPTPVPDGHRRVRWVYNPDNSLHGKVVDMPAGDAQRLRRENRVAYVDADTLLGHPDTEQASPAEQAGPAEQVALDVPAPDDADQDADQAQTPGDDQASKAPRKATRAADK